VDLVGGCYLVQGTVRLTRRSGLTIDGHGAVIKATVENPAFTDRAQILLDLGSNLTIRNLTLQGTNATPDCATSGAVSCYDSAHEWDHNLHIKGTDGVLVDRVTFRHAWGDAVSLSPGGAWDGQGNGALMARNVTVQNSSVDTTGRMAFACTGCRNFTVQDSTITNVGYHVVDVEVEGAVWTGDVTLLRNTFSNVYLSLLSAAAGETGSGPFVVRDNRQLDQPVTCQEPVNIGQPGMAYGASTITGNVLHSYGDGFHVSGTSTTITGNSVTIGSGGCGNGSAGSGTTGAVVSAAAGSVTGNTFTAARPVATAPSGVTVCGNSVGAGYNLPSLC
jgi:hypothetical protein